MRVLAAVLLGLLIASSPCLGSSMRRSNGRNAGREDPRVLNVVRFISNCPRWDLLGGHNPGNANAERQEIMAAMKLISKNKSSVIGRAEAILAAHWDAGSYSDGAMEKVYLLNRYIFDVHGKFNISHVKNWRLYYCVGVPRDGVIDWLWPLAWDKRDHLTLLITNQFPLGTMGPPIAGSDVTAEFNYMRSHFGRRTKF